jgi:hypothetical protein
MENTSIVEELTANFRTTQNLKKGSDPHFLKQDMSLRPTIYIGLGGFGCSVIRDLKKTIQDLMPNPDIRSGFGFIAVDTHHSEKNDVLNTNEYISVTSVTPHIVSNHRDNKKYLDWYNKIHKGSFKAPTITGGAGQIRAVGRLALLFPPTLNRFYNVFNTTYNNVNAFSAKFADNASTKVYIISSLAGGTGSGMFLDVSVIVREYLNMAGAIGAPVQAIFATAESWEGRVPSVLMPVMYANTYSALKDIHHFAQGNTQRMSYSIPGYESVVIDNTKIPNPIHLVTNQNSDGKVIFKDYDELKHVITSYLLFEIYTPLKGEGDTKVQDNENPVFSDISEKGGIRFISSLGVVRFGIPIDEIEKYYSAIIMLNAINAELEDSISNRDIEEFIVTNKLGEYQTDQLQDQIKRDPQNEGKMVSMSLDLLTEVEGVKHSDLMRVCKNSAETKLKQLKDRYRIILTENAKNTRMVAENALHKRLEEIASNRSLASVLTFINDLKTNFGIHNDSLIEELNEANVTLSKLSDRRELSLGVVHNSAQSGFFGRKKRIEHAITTFEADLQAELNHQITLWAMEDGLNIYNALNKVLSDVHSTWSGAVKSVEAKKHYVTRVSLEQIKKLEKFADVNYKGKGNRFSIISVSQVNDLYMELIGPDMEAELAGRLQRKWKDNKTLRDLVTDDETWFSQENEGVLPGIKKILSDFNLMEAIKRYYGDEATFKNLISRVISLGNPLFPLDPQMIEYDYSSAMIVAINQSLEEDFLKKINFLTPAGVGKSIARYPNSNEAIFYSLKFGYTAFSLTRTNYHFAHYSRLIESYKKAVNSRGYHIMAEAENFAELIPVSKEEEEVRKWFAVARGLNYVFPTSIQSDGKPNADKNESFIWSKGSYYYFNMDVDFKKMKIKLGPGLKVAIAEFGEKPEYREYIQEQVNNLVSEKGTKLVRDKLVNDYIPLLELELDKSSKSDYERKKEIENLLSSIREFCHKELVVNNI